MEYQRQVYDIPESERDGRKLNKVQVQNKLRGREK